ncbi:MAG: hypothetical protein ACLTSX_05525 [Collinsella sp.]
MFEHVNALSYAEIDRFGTPSLITPHHQRRQPGSARHRFGRAPAHALAAAFGGLHGRRAGSSMRS